MATTENSEYRMGADFLKYATNEQLESWSRDPNCSNREEVAKLLENRLSERDQKQATKKRELETNPFDPRTEVSADARYIASRVVKHLWLILVLLPAATGIFLLLVTALKGK